MPALFDPTVSPEASEFPPADYWLARYQDEDPREIAGRMRVAVWALGALALVPLGAIGFLAWWLA